MEFKNHIPIYVQIVDLVKLDYITGHLSPGDKLESVRDYAQKLKVNPNTVQKAYQEIERIGLAESRRGLGTFMTEDPTIKEQIAVELANQYTQVYIQNMKTLAFSRDEIVEKLKDVLQEDL